MTAVLMVTLMTTGLAAPLPHTRTGQGPAVVLVHGMGGDRHVWDALVKELAPTHTVIALDLPAHGQAVVPKRIDFDAIARQIAATVRAEKAAPAVIVGHSLGGAIVGHVPLVDAAAVRALVIVDSGIGALFSASEIAQLRAGLAKDREGTLRGWFGQICQPQQLDRVLSGVRKLSNETVLGYLSAIAEQAVPDGGAAIGAPVLVMATKLTLPDPKQPSAGLAALGFAHVEKLQVEMFDHSMHWPFWDEPEKFTTVLTRFLSTVEK